MRNFFIASQRVVVLSLAVAAASVVSFAGVDQVEPGGASAKRVAFTAESSSKIFNAAGTEVNSMTTTLATRADGSTVKIKREFDLKGRQPEVAIETREIHDVQQRTHVEVHPSVQSKITMRMDEATAARLASRPAAGCADGAATEGGAANARLLGFPVVKKTRTSGARAQQTMTVEEWVAPGLDCLPLKVSAVLQEADGRVVSRATQEVTRVRVGEPDATLFEVPSGLTERSPSEVMAADMAQRGTQCRRCVSAGVVNADENYRRRHN